MHGEYKVPGGKLVIADVEQVDGKLADVRISGDFFLEPAEALDDILAALNGLPADLSPAETTAAITAGLRPGTQLVGFTAADITTAVRRALGLSKTWRDFDWQIIDGAPESPAMHLALDEVLAREVAAGRRAPTLRFWQWDRPAIIIGNFQSLSNEVDLEAAQSHGIQTVRRVTGGGAMFVEPGSAITYSLYAPESLVADMDFAASYAFLDMWVIKALNELGVDAVYKPLNDIASSKGKIGGAAQKRFAGGVVLHHATMSYDVDVNKMFQVLRIGREKLSDKGITSAQKRVDPVRSQTGLPRDEVITRMKATFTDLNGGSTGAITADERRAAEALASSKFEDPQWLRHVP
ncbi:lipoate--protein ligase family protein [Ketogulonicigenium vulgare]|uniref:Lipoate-protein ligase A n=1 Tax=Ketogulonicigenium vulgare (strain WSH-001) TaxID=759362 RepID=F9Y3L3_KETVW|nr:biotin/lipoate A/B protein ligase family protein [Ketogulonicigenium vulgare]ADO43346.1 biotin/lipoate A/B protein ligase [Ketogulonicigenium vulgare Y25]AEM41633.1 Lipoate-protein ligase A [Ketogulonicigenium vulgare WSH-001]ALJ81746.1 lipoate--protein ligase [Ketogulonicigenium vulgare]ANW34409.1 lipoate--protein ligase [Ketogulonicigenium vulgare]AOZ55383.1 biotin/lipoate A/B protein ligase [Ketogulonicigenium vulgare]